MSELSITHGGIAISGSGTAELRPGMQSNNHRLNQMKTKEVAERKERERVYQIQQAKQEQERLAQKPKNRTVYRTPRTRTSTQQREREPIKRRSKKYYKRLPTTRGKKR